MLGKLENCLTIGITARGSKELLYFELILIIFLHFLCLFSTATTSKKKLKHNLKTYWQKDPATDHMLTAEKALQCVFLSAN
jgi:hypothetical protein